MSQDRLQELQELLSLINKWDRIVLQARRERDAEPSGSDKWLLANGRVISYTVGFYNEVVNSSAYVLLSAFIPAIPAAQ